MGLGVGISSRTATQSVMSPIYCKIGFERLLIPSRVVILEAGTVLYRTLVQIHTKQHYHNAFDVTRVS